MTLIIGAVNKPAPNKAFLLGKSIKSTKFAQSTYLQELGEQPINRIKKLEPSSALLEKKFILSVLL